MKARDDWTTGEAQKTGIWSEVDYYIVLMDIAKAMYKNATGVDVADD